MELLHIENEILGDASVSDDYGRQVEAIFQKMKQLATQAGWPASLTPEIVAVDKEWQKTKEDANAAKRSTSSTAGAVKTKLESMVSRLESYLKDRGGSGAPSSAPGPTPSAGSNPTPPSNPSGESSDFLDILKREYGPLPLWGWGAGAIGLLLVISFLPRRTSR